MRERILRLAAELARRGEPFALATVVRREPPASARLGDVALITAGGAFHGWVGGTCARPTVVREALAALADGEPRLIALDPDPGARRALGIRIHPMTCQSGGSLDIYVDPVLPPPSLYVFGVSPVARALAELAKTLGYEVVAVDPDADEEAFPRADRIVPDLDLGTEDPAPLAGRYAVVATQGQWDEAATRRALELAPDYLGIVASRRRFEEIGRMIGDRGASAEDLARIDSPAGIDIGAVDPEEIALSVLAAIVERRRSRGGQPAVGRAPSGTEDPPAEAAIPPSVRDPVCGMEIVPGTGVPTAEHAGETWHFCCGGCRERFLREPERYAEPASGSRG